MADMQQALAFVEGQAHKINQRIYETRYPDYDFGRLIFVDTSGPEWAPGVMTYSSDFVGKAEWMSGYAKDVPNADVMQSMTTRTFSLAAIGYEWNIEEVNSTMAFPGASLPDRRARAARLAYQKFMYDLTLFGDDAKGVKGLINQANVTPTAAPNDGTSSSRYWVNSSGVGQKTPEKILRDINIALMGVYNDTFGLEVADTILLPHEALVYIAQTPYSSTTMETVLSFIRRNNLYTLETGRELTIRSIPALSTASTAGTANKGRMVAYKNSPEFVKLHLPMPHRFLSVYQAGPMHFQVPGIFRTGGVELLTTKTMRYLDAISEPLA